MPTLLLIRHGRSSANTAQILAGRTPGVHLDDTGREQAVALAGRLAGLDLAAVVTSPLERCVETAVLAVGGAPIPDERATECDYGEWTGRQLGDLSTDPLWRTIQQTPSAVTFPQGEAIADMAARVVASVQEWDARVREEHSEWKAWALFSHADPIKAVVAAAIGLPLDRFQSLVVHPASVTVIHYHSPDSASLLSLNSIFGQVAPLVPARPPVQPGGDAGAAYRATP